MVADAGVPVRTSEGARRIVWSKMKMREAPVLWGRQGQQAIGQVLIEVTGTVTVTYASFNSCSVSG